MQELSHRAIKERLRGRNKWTTVGACLWWLEDEVEGGARAVAPDNQRKGIKARNKWRTVLVFES
eukprot:1158013-Pelagomonas_calceolata.AAC.8